MRTHLLLCVLMLLGSSALAHADGIEPTPAAVTADPQRDKAHPPSLKAIALPVKGGRINAVLFKAAGDGPHPAVLLLHGLPGNEQNLDLAQDMRRDGWDVLTLHYRGAWGSPGVFSFAHCLEDAASAIVWMRAADGGGAEGIDRRHIALVGHSMGGWIAALTLASDAEVLGAAVITPGDIGALAALPRPQRIAALDQTLDYSAGVRALEGATPASLADEADLKAKAFSLMEAAQGVRGRPVLVVSADDGLAGVADAYAKAAQSAAGEGVTTRKFETDHSFSDQRIALGALLLRWLENLPGAPAAM